MSLTEHVDPAIELIEPRFRDQPGPELTYLRSHAFFNQLAPADACLSSFLAYELDPGAAGPVGGGRAWLGAILGRQEELAEPLRRAVAVAVTSSYLAMMTTEDPPGSDWTAERDAESLWRFWIGHLRPAGILAFGIPARFVRSAEQEGGRYLESEIKRLGLQPGLLRRRALSARCNELSRFGLLLRLGQTNRRSEAEPEWTQAAGEAWPLHA
jgi:hypothetical protein